MPKYLLAALSFAVILAGLLADAAGAAIKLLSANGAKPIVSGC